MTSLPGPSRSPARSRPDEAGAGDLAAWLVTGSDPSLVSEAVAALLTKVVAKADRSLVLEDFSGDDIEIGAVADACRTPPFLSDRRVVVVRDAGRFTPEQLQPLVEYLAAPLATTRLVVAAGGGQIPTKLVNAFKQSPVAEVVTSDVSTKDAHAWVADRLAHAAVKLSAQAATLVEAHLGDDLNRLGSVLGVLETVYGKGARLGPEEVQPYLGRPGAVPPWDLTDAIDRGDTDRALSLLHRLIEAGDRHPLVVLAVLQRHFGNILRVQSPSIASEAQAAEAMGIARGRSTFPARKALDAARRLGPTGTGDAVVALADAELALKGKVDWPPELVLEVLLARLCRLSRSSRPGGHGAGTARHGTRA